LGAHAPPGARVVVVGRVRVGEERGAAERIAARLLDETAPPLSALEALPRADAPSPPA
jgi:hypothetical protein